MTVLTPNAVVCFISFYPAVIGPRTALICSITDSEGFRFRGFRSSSEVGILRVLNE